MTTNLECAQKPWWLQILWIHSLWAVNSHKQVPHHPKPDRSLASRCGLSSGFLCKLSHQTFHQTILIFFNCFPALSQSAIEYHKIYYIVYLQHYILHCKNIKLLTSTGVFSISAFRNGLWPKKLCSISLPSLFVTCLPAVFFWILFVVSHCCY